MIVNKRAFARLDKDTQKIIMDAAQHVEAEGWKRVVLRGESDTQILKDNGMTVSEPTENICERVERDRCHDGFRMGS